jgi:hypothetical protein
MEVSANKLQGKIDISQGKRDKDVSEHMKRIAIPITGKAMEC